MPQLSISEVGQVCQSSMMSTLHNVNYKGEVHFDTDV